MRYLSQRFSMPNRMATAVLNDIGTEELAHLEMVSTIVHQLTRNLSMEEIKNSGFGPYYIDHTVGIWPQAAGGIPFNACEFQSKETLLQTFTKTLLRNKKPEARMTTFCGLSGICLKLPIRLNSSGHVKLFIFKDLVKLFVPSRKNLTQRTSMLLTQALICGFLTLRNRKTVIKRHHPRFKARVYSSSFYNKQVLKAHMHHPRPGDLQDILHNIQ